ncbi:glutamate receptor 2.8 [Coffea arabica]|uniref:Glutamate receptor n=1 Tax=Coffea arabica TaxID=13443 RepID=A0A6P6S4V3_COFAR
MRKKQTHDTLLFLALFFFSDELLVARTTSTIDVDVGLVLDMNSWAGKMSSRCISMAFSDFYASHSHYKTRLVLHTRDSNNSVIGAAHAASDLMTNAKVQAILGPQTSMQANFLINLGQDAEIPIVSFSATSPTLSSLRSAYFIRATLNDSCQAQAISSLLQTFGWREAVPIYVDTEFGEGIIPYLTDALQEAETHIPYRSVIHPSATDGEIAAELYKLMTMQTRVFIVHMPPILGYRLFDRAKEVGMMTEEYVWIITTGITNHLSFLHLFAKESMQGVIGVKPHVPRRKKLNRFIARWKRKYVKDNVDVTFFGLWAYDAATALAIAVENALAKETRPSSAFHLESGVSQIGKHLPEVISRTKFNGLTGTFNVLDGQLQSSDFQIVNILSNGERGVGFWTPDRGITRTLQPTTSESHSSSKANLKGIIWPGDSTSTPKGWVIPTNGKKLRVGIPVRSGPNEFVNIIRDPCTNKTTFTGYSIDVFDSLMKMLPYYVPYEYVPFAKSDGESAGTYDDLVYQVFLKNYDAAVGDITIRANRSTYVDFTQPYAESGITMVVPVYDRRSKNAWVFLKPLTWDLWVISACFFVFIGFVIWILVHRTNEEFSGSSPHQVATGFWFSFSILVFAHREKIVSNLARFVVIIWCFVVLILTQSYTASLASMLTMQQLEPTITHMQDLIRKDDNVGYAKGSFVLGFLKHMKFAESRLKEYDTLDDLDVLFTKDKAHGGIAAVFGEVPYMKLFLSKYCSKYAMVSPAIKTDGFGFAFPIGSPLVPDISRAVLNLTEGDKIVGIENEWLGQQTSCPEQTTLVSSHSLGLNSFWGLFLIVGIASFTALIIYGAMFIYEHRLSLSKLHAKDLWDKITICFRKREEEQDSGGLQMMNRSMQSSRHLQKTNHSILSMRTSSSSSSVSSRSSSGLLTVADVNLFALREGGNSFV